MTAESDKRIPEPKPVLIDFLNLRANEFLTVSRVNISNEDNDSIPAVKVLKVKHDEYTKDTVILDTDFVTESIFSAALNWQADQKQKDDKIFDSLTKIAAVCGWNYSLSE